MRNRSVLGVCVVGLFVALFVGVLGVVGCSGGDAKPMMPSGAGGAAGASASGAAGGSSAAGSGAGSSAEAGAAGDGQTGAAGAGVAGAGTAGTTSTGTAGGSAAGAGGPDGSATGAGGAATGTHASGQSAGCGTTVNDVAGKWVEHDVMVDVASEYAASYKMRKYFTMMPAGYDSSRAYPVTFWGPGCGASGAEPNKLMDSGDTQDYIQVFLLQNTSCFSTSAADSPEVPYFDAALSGVEGGYCVDKSKVFVAGYSSGSWLTHLLGCQRGNVIRGIGSASGGLLVDHGTCTGPIAAIMTADTSDTTNPIMSIDTKTGIDRGSGAARNRILTANGCTMQTTPWDAAFPGCVAYQGCMTDYPVVWCLTMGQGHSDGGDYSAKGFWKFWSALPSLP
jgi:poly(3-hydroxybutyrate) depolymerase